MAELSARQCSRCRGRSLPCRVNDNADRCLECIKSCGDCSLAPLSIPKWRRLQEKREQLEREHGEALAKATRTYTEIQSLRAQQDKMVKQELENIAVQEKEEQESAAMTASSELVPFNNVDFSAVDWSQFVPSTPQSSQGN